MARLYIVTQQSKTKPKGEWVAGLVTVDLFQEKADITTAETSDTEYGALQKLQLKLVEICNEVTHKRKLSARLLTVEKDKPTCPESINEHPSHEITAEKVMAALRKSLAELEETENQLLIQIGMIQETLEQIDEYR